MAVALQEGLDILIQDKNVLSCWSDRWDAIWYAELGSSWAVLNAGFNIDCMISRSASLHNLPLPSAFAFADQAFEFPKRAPLYDTAASCVQSCLFCDLPESSSVSGICTFGCEHPRNKCMISEDGSGDDVFGH